MRSFRLSASLPFAMLLALPACGLFGGEDDGEGSGAGDTTSSTGEGAGSTGSDTTTTTTGSGAGTPGEPGWTIVPLIDDETNPDSIVYHAGNSLVTGIHFASLDQGVLVVTGDNQTFSDGGAVFGATQKEVTDVRFGGDGTGLCLLGTVDFQGIVKTSDGYVAMAHACDLISSKDGGATFGIEPVGVGEPFGIEQILAFRESGSGAMLVRDTGVVSRTTTKPGPNAIWDDSWAPRAIPPIPDPVPADQCQSGPDSQNVPAVAQATYVSQDGQFIAYTASPDYDPQICISTDGGVSFFPKILPGVAEDVLFAPPTGVVFTSATNGITWHATNIYPGAAYIYRTTDGGETWAKVELPAEVASKSLELKHAFFAPDGQHGWLVGYNYDNSIALMLKTSDGGASWKLSGGDLAAKVSDAGGGKLFTGFALDEHHIWVGGEYGIFAANAAGGE